MPLTIIRPKKLSELGALSEEFKFLIKHIYYR